ncbi:MAG: heavy-metal-associated domain-containing protein [Aequorivita sp.]
MKNTITVQNLKCGGCAKTITTNLSAIKNISDVKIDVDESAISFHSVDAESTIKVKEKLKSLGYPSTEDSNSFSSKAKSFVSCATGKL